MDASLEPRQRIAELSTSVSAFAVLACAAEAGLLELLAEPRDPHELAVRCGLEPALVERVLEVLVALGLARREGALFAAAPGMQPMLRLPGKDDFLAELRTTYLQSWDAILRAKQGRWATGWTHTDPELLQAQGRSGRALMQTLAEQVFPRIEDLDQRLRDPSTAFLDAGTGVGVLAIELCRHYPNLRAVGIDVQDAALSEARRNVAAARLEDRIELRLQGIEELTDRRSFDLAFFPQVFMPVEIVQRGLATIFEALRPGGWVMMPAMGAPGPGLEDALARLRVVVWGGTVLLPEQIAEMAREAGYAPVQIGGGPGGGMGVLGRRPAAG